jgi:hypothetical protein
LVKPLADRQAQAPQRDVVGNVGRTDGAEIDRVELSSVWRGHRPASWRRACGNRPTPVEGLDVELDVAHALLKAFEHRDAGGDDFGADAIGGMAAMEYSRI